MPNWKGWVGLGVALLLFGGYTLYRKDSVGSDSSVEIIENTDTNKEIVIEVGGAVEKPGVYRFESNARVNDALVSAGGLSATADRILVEKYLNRASILTDGQKIYVPSLDSARDEHLSASSANQSDSNQTVSSPVLSYQRQLEPYSSGMVNINTATLSELDTLPGIGQVYGGKIIEQRPYSNIEELLSKKVIPQNTFEKIKNLISVY